MSNLANATGSSSGKVSNERIVTLEVGQTMPVRRASGRDDVRKAVITNLNFRNTHLSKTHALLKYDKGFYIRDLESTFGTVLNSRYIIPGAWFPLCSGDELGFIIAKPSGFIADVCTNYPGKDSIPMSEFGKASLGLEFRIVTNKNTIKFVPSELYVAPLEGLEVLTGFRDHFGNNGIEEVINIEDDKDDLSTTLTSDHESNSSVPSDQDYVIDMTDDEEWSRKWKAEHGGAEEKKKEEEEEDNNEEEEEEEDDTLYNFGTCPGMAGTIQRFDPPVKAVEEEEVSPTASLAATVKKFVSRSKDNLVSLKERFASSRSDLGESNSNKNEEDKPENDSIDKEDSSKEQEKTSTSSQAIPLGYPELAEYLLRRLEARAPLFTLQDQDMSGFTSDSDASSYLLSPEQESDNSVESDSDLDTDSSGSRFDSEHTEDEGSECCVGYFSDSPDPELKSEATSWKGLKYRPGDDLYVEFDGEDSASDIDIEHDPWCLPVTEERGSRKRSRRDIEEDFDSSADEDLAPPGKKVKKSSSLIKTIVKEAGKGAIYVLATITALGVYGSTLNSQK